MSNKNEVYLGEDLLDRTYVDLHDSGTQVIKIVGTDYLVPGMVICQAPNGRCWQRPAKLVKPLIEAHERHVASNGVRIMVFHRDLSNRTAEPNGWHNYVPAAVLDEVPPEIWTPDKHSPEQFWIDVEVGWENEPVAQRLADYGMDREKVRSFMVGDFFVVIHGTHCECKVAYVYRVESAGFLRMEVPCWESERFDEVWKWIRECDEKDWAELQQYMAEAEARKQAGMELSLGGEVVAKVLSDAITGAVYEAVSEVESKKKGKKSGNK